MVVNPRLAAFLSRTRGGSAILSALNKRASVKVVSTPKKTVSETVTVLPLSPAQKMVEKIKEIKQEQQKPVQQPAPYGRTPIPTSTASTTIKPSQEIYSSVQKEIIKAEIQTVMNRNLSPKERQGIIKGLQTQSQQIKEYQSRGFIAQETMVPGELAPGQMGPPAPVKGYSFSVPESQKLEFAKTQVKQANQYPPVIREVVQFGQGIESSLFSVVSPIAGLFGKQKEFDTMASIAMAQGTSGNMMVNPRGFSKNLSENLKASEYGNYYPSTLDFALEPIGVAPKGTSEFLLKNPAFMAGGVGGEVAQWVVGGEIIKYGSKAVKPLARIIVPRVESTIGKVIPKVEQFVGKTAPSVTEWAGKQTIFRNVSKFGKGYEPVSKGVEKLVSQQSRKIVEGATTVTGVARTFKAVPKRVFGFAEREFVPKSVSKNLLKPNIEIFATMRPVTKEASIVFEEVGYKSGWRGVLREFKSVSVVSRGGKTFVESSSKDFPSRFGSLYKFNEVAVKAPISGGERISSKYGTIYKTFFTKSGRPISRPLLESELAFAHSKVQWLHTAVIPSQRGWGIPSVAKQIAKRWLLRAEEAVGSITRQVSKSRLVSTGGKVVGNLSRDISVFMPVSRFGSRVGELGVYSIGRTTFGSSQRVPSPPVYGLGLVSPFREHITEHENIPKEITVDIPVVKQKQFFDVVPIQVIKQDVFQETIKKQEHKQILRTIPRYSDIPNEEYLPMFPLFPRDMYGRGTREGGGGKFLMEEYKFRKAKIGLPFDVGGKFKEFRI